MTSSPGLPNQPEFRGERTALISVLGALIVRGPRGEHPIPSGRTTAVLEWLVAHREMGVTVERTIGALWPEAPGADQRAALRGYLSRLRRSLPDPDIVVRRDDGRLGLDMDVAEIDIDGFLSDLSRGTDNLADGRPEVSLDHLDRALGHWRGDAYASLQDTAIGIAESNRLSVQRTDAEVARCAAWIATARPGRALPVLDDVVRHDPSRETAWRLLMVASAAAGNRVAGARAFQDCRRALAGMGQRPAEETVALEHLVLDGSPIDVGRLVQHEFAGQRHPRPPARSPEDGPSTRPRVMVVVVDDPATLVADRVAETAGNDPLVIELDRRTRPGDRVLEQLATALEGADLGGAPDRVRDLVRDLRSWPETADDDPAPSAQRMAILTALTDIVQAAARRQPLAIVVPQPTATPVLVSVLRHLADNGGSAPVLVVLVADPSTARRLITATDDVVDLR